MIVKFYEFAGRVSICDCTLRGRGKPLPYVTTKRAGVSAAGEELVDDFDG